MFSPATGSAGSRRFLPWTIGGEALVTPFTPTFPVVFKARRCGYDGQGTLIFPDQAALDLAWSQHQDPSKAWLTAPLIEAFIPFERELAVIAARSVMGEVVVYPVVETQQHQQVCRRVLVPADLPPQVIQTAQAIAQTLLTALEAVGVFGIEFFYTAEGKLLVNEISPRTHNSGHYTLDACETSQFEQHLRAVSQLPLGSPALKCPGAVMVNLLGYEYAKSDYWLNRQALAAMPQTFVHWYGKTESRPGRKLGHVTVLLDQACRAQALAIADQIESVWYGKITNSDL
ncbi:5-(carboxyamino)imidazole ribonucleotide synthase [Neosynechococcus sphagnicola]|uniref:5-(carboxyamino)imidazole ribonucleotide synthase n=1 Tax=Neosynechococcus sphagnicola TaxID=1501145 RepID=UPI000ABD6272|nr:ATP-grasp domain-containing protein [Neosynechococcus sphagnicola]